MTTATAMSLDLFRDAVAAATRAPSIYNCQPWRFTLRGDQIEVRLDRDRDLPLADPSHWGARVACGAALANIRLSLTAAGYISDIRMFPDPADDDWIAAVRLSGPHPPTPRDRSLHAAIPARHSNRRPFFDAEVPAGATARLVKTAEREGAWLVPAGDRSRVARIADIIRTADDDLRRDSAYRAEMEAWLGHEDQEGITSPAASIAPAAQDLLAMRDYGGAERAEGRDFETDPLLAVLGTSSQGGHDDVRAGIAMQLVLLAATDERLATSMLSQPMEIPTAREELRRAVAHAGRAHMVIRIGYGQPLEPSPRRPLDAVIDEP